MLAVAAAALGRRIASLLLAAFAVVNAVVVSPAWLPPAPAGAETGDAVRLMLANVHTANRDHSRVLDAIREASPDVLLVEEVNERWLAELAALSPEWPVVVADPREDNFGIALLSRIPLDGARLLVIGEARVPSVVARIPTRGRSITLLGTHPLPPSSAPYARHRDEQLVRIADLLATIDSPKVLLGDLNVSPWSVHFRRLVDGAGLLDSRTGRGVQPTWPADFWPMLVPIDHCLHSADLRIVGRRTGPSIGSDHYPVIVDLAL